MSDSQASRPTGPEQILPRPLRPDPVRPEPDRSWRTSLRARFVRLREQARTRRELSGLARDLGGRQQLVSAQDPGRPDHDAAPLPRSTPPLALAAIAVGAAVCALGLLWGWQTWSSRSSEPIDGLLPLLTVDGATDDADVVSLGATNQPTSTGVPDASAAGQAGTPSPQILPPGGAAPSVPPAGSPVSIIVHISGAVLHPGVVEVGADARVFQAVELAGGATLLADLDRVNLAAPMIDGERIHVPTEGEDVPPTLAHQGAPEPSTGAPATEPVVIDINIASVADLETLPGIGPSIASAIVQTRSDRGPFLNVDELLDVPGIGESKLTLISPFVTVAG